MHPTAHLIVANGRISDLMVQANQSRLANAVALENTTPKGTTSRWRQLVRAIRRLAEPRRSRRTAAI